jgi:hypothetical protein
MYAIVSLYVIQVTRALRDCPNALEMGPLREIVDPILGDIFPHDCVYKVENRSTVCYIYNWGVCSYDFRASFTQSSVQ